MTGERSQVSSSETHSRGDEQYETVSAIEGCRVRTGEDQKIKKFN